MDSNSDLMLSVDMQVRWIPELDVQIQNAGSPYLYIMFSKPYTFLWYNYVAVIITTLQDYDKTGLTDNIRPHWYSSQEFTYLGTVIGSNKRKNMWSAVFSLYFLFYYINHLF